MADAMQYPFTEGGDYLSGDQQKAVDEFVIREGNECHCGWVYEGKKGKRMVMRSSLPLGCVTPLTVKVRFAGPDGGSVRYHTPLATNVGGDVRISYRDMATGDVKSCTSVEWFEWCGPAVKGYAPTPAETSAQEEVFRRMIVAQMDKKEADLDKQKEIDAAKAKEIAKTN
jgi:hypothetical protein